jgi:uncharacterized protein YqfB (UPF0267 family)
VERKAWKLKILEEFFRPISTGHKTFEIRQEDDKKFSQGDILLLQEIRESGEYTGNQLYAAVSYVTRDSRFVKDGYAVMSIVPTPPTKEVVDMYLKTRMLMGIKD